MAVGLVASDTILHDARAIAGLETERLATLLPGAEVIHTGASSLPGLVTRGDVDLHVRVPPEDFVAAVAALVREYDPVHESMWTDGFATFATDRHALPTGLAVTAVGDAHDERFRSAWARLAAEPELRARYNALKRAAIDQAAYEAAKGVFFWELEDPVRRR